MNINKVGTYLNSLYYVKYLKFNILMNCSLLNIIRIWILYFIITIWLYLPTYIKIYTKVGIGIIIVGNKNHLDRHRLFIFIISVLLYILSKTCFNYLLSKYSKYPSILIKKPNYIYIILYIKSIKFIIIEYKK